ncbi:hypothetical protein BJV78DRAFT_350633 [Lactifluus subvellereus]|nr:hypothetical protein BJV78DRAFT_350633 [Lactifluus subvellereus]
MVRSLDLGPDEMLLIQVPEHGGNKRKRDEEEKVVETDVSPPGAKLLKTEVGKAAPSSLAYPGEFSKIAGPGHAITCNRPFEYDTIPLVLLHEAFGIFKDRCEAAPSEQALACLEELAHVGCKWYASEAIRRPEIQSVLQKHMGLRLHEQKVPGTEFTTDGNLITIVMPAAIRECRNEHGDVLFQVILFYGNFLNKALEDPLCYHNCDTRFPSILIVDMGSYLGFYGAAWDGVRVRVEPLTPIFDLSTHWRETKARHAIASSLDALIVAVRNIQAHYDAVEAEAKANPVPSREYDLHLQKARGYPFMTSYNDNGQEITFTYDARLDNAKLIFSATLNQPNSDQCLVKFTRQYSEAAHNYLASRGSAPTLRQCVRVSAEWTAVIMDRSKYQVLYGLSLPEADQENVRRKVKSEMQMLHNEGFVHGDIRDTNLLVDLDSLASDDVVVHFIDLDWAGRIGEARYPIGVNTKTVKRPDGVKSGELITKQHDEDMVSYLFG